ncbi:MAG: S41 family peptidase [Pseudomonadota bacterium]
MLQRCAAMVFAVIATNVLANELLPYPARYTERQLAGDLGMVEGALREMHPDLERGASYAAFESAIRFASGELGKTSTETGFLVALSRMVFLIGNGHTEIRLSEAAERFYDHQPMYLGFEFRHTDSHTYISRDYYGADDRLVGREVAAINGTPAERIRSLMAGFVSGDGAIDTGRLHKMGDPVLFSRWWRRLWRPATEFEVRFVGDDEALTFDGLTRHQLETRRQQRDSRPNCPPSVWSEAYRTAIVYRCQLSTETATQQIAEWFDAIVSEDTTSVILDLRGDASVSPSNAVEVIRHLVDHEAVLYENAFVNRPSFDYGVHASGDPVIYPSDQLVAVGNERFSLTEGIYPFLVSFTPAKKVFAGRLILLIDGSTNGVASDLASRLHQERSVTVLGEESGGAYHGKTSMARQTLVLPHTKMRLTIPLERFDASYSYVAEVGRGVMPNETVVPTGDDIAQRRDPVLARALELAQTP